MNTTRDILRSDRTTIRFRYEREPHFLHVDILGDTLNVTINPRLTDEILCNELERIINPALQSHLYAVASPEIREEIIDEIRADLHKEMETNEYLRNTIELY